MEPAYTATMKWLIGLLTVSFIGLGSWLGVIVYRNQHPMVVSTPMSSSSNPMTQLPAPVATSLMDPTQATVMTETAPHQATNSEKQSASGSATSSLATTALVKSGSNQLSTTTSSSKAVPTPAATAPVESVLSVAVTTTSTGELTTVVVTANQAVQAGFGTASGGFATTQTLSFRGTDSRTLIVRTKGGQETRFQISGSSSSTASSTSFTSNTSASVSSASGAASSASSATSAPAGSSSSATSTSTTRS